MPRLSQAEIRNNAIAFVHEWKDETSERSESQTFWNEFFQVFGLRRRDVAVFEKSVQRPAGKFGKIDLFWKGVVLAEHKSAGENLDKATSQAFEYLERVAESDRPQFVLISDFAHFRLYDLESGAEYAFNLAALPDKTPLFGFISGYQKREFKEQDPVNIKAALKLGALHDALADAGYRGHKLEAFLVRLVYCLFADDTGIFTPRESLLRFLNQKTAIDGSNVGAMLGMLFQVLDTPDNERAATLDEDLHAFQYVNGALFRDRHDMPSFDARRRKLLIDACETDWSKVSPAIFGSLFQSVMDKDKRRNLGAHYTSEKNILKVVHGLFLDDLLSEFDGIKNNLSKLRQFQDKLAGLRFFDPACGCGNFLVIAYREMRRLELEVLKQIRQLEGQTKGDRAFQGQLESRKLSKLSVDQYYGIEVEEFPAEIARVALWVTDHLANLELSAEFGIAQFELPLLHTPNIVHGNALRLDWRDVVGEPDANLFILGNPPFVGAMIMNESQRKDMSIVFAEEVPSFGVLDYVTAWYYKSAKFVQGTKMQVAFVSTNSIVQGEQTHIFWRPVQSNYGIRINFAHRTFKWRNEAKGNAAVFCVIVGFATFDKPNKRIFEYEDIKGEPQELKAKNINAYLVDAEDLFIQNKSHPICDTPKMSFGSMPRDGGNLIFTLDEKNEFLRSEPLAEKWFRPYTGAQEFINGYVRYCLWLVDIKPDELRKLPMVLERIGKVRDFRIGSNAASTRKFAQTPAVFCQIAQPDSSYLLVPRVSSERRKFIPIGYLGRNVIANDQVLTVPKATLFHFGVLTSTMHMAWVKTLCGRLKSDYRYSKDIVYNNYPWPENPTEKQVKAIETAAQRILDVRAEFPDSSLADLYDPLAMPPKLVKAHNELDRAVDLTYRPQPFTNEAKRMVFLFELYGKYTAGLFMNMRKKSKVSRV